MRPTPVNISAHGVGSWRVLIACAGERPDQQSLGTACLLTHRLLAGSEAGFVEQRDHRSEGRRGGRGSADSFDLAADDDLVADGGGAAVTQANRAQSHDRRIRTALNTPGSPRRGAKRPFGEKRALVRLVRRMLFESTQKFLVGSLFSRGATAGGHVGSGWRERGGGNGLKVVRSRGRLQSSQCVSES